MALRESGRSPFFLDVRKRLRRYCPFLDLRGSSWASLRGDAAAALALLFVAVPQSIAYALIAGLPPAMGLYAAAFPVIVGSLLRSSRHVATGPTNAVSLLVGSAIVAAAGLGVDDAVAVALTLAVLAGAMQTAAGLLRLDVIVDYISVPVLRGYITAAAVLIAAGQLANATGTAGRNGNLLDILAGWAEGIGGAEPLALGIAGGTAALTLALRRIDRRIPGAILALGAGIAASFAFDLPARGLEVVADVAPIPLGFPPLTWPSLELVPLLVSSAAACAVLSLVEASSVGRAIASRTGQRLDMSVEFTGQGLANVAAGFTGGYPVGGSLGRSVLLESAGGKTRLAGAASGILMLAVLAALGPLFDATPIASLAGLLFVLAADLVDVRGIREALSGTLGDRLGFVVTLAGAWILPLDRAIYLGVGVSVILFLRRARLLAPRELVISEKGRFREVDPELADVTRPCPAIRILNLNGPIFFAVAGELTAAIDRRIADPSVRVLIVRVWQARDLDVTTAGVLEASARRLGADGRALLVAGIRRSELALLVRTGMAARIGTENLFVRDPGSRSAMEPALRRALAITGPHHSGATCPLEEYLSER